MAFFIGLEPIWLLLLSSFGLVMSAYIWYKKTNKSKLVCIIGDDCNKVINSKFSKIYWIENEMLGMIFFAFVFITTIMQLFYPQFFLINVILLSRNIISFIGFVYSLYLILVQIAIIREFCEYCLVISMSTIGIFIVLFF